MRKLRSTTRRQATFRLGGHERFIHDAANSARATPALGAAAKAMVDLPRRSRNVLAGRQRRTHVVVREHVAGTHNHCKGASGKPVPTSIPRLVRYKNFNSRGVRRLQRKKR